MLGFTLHDDEQNHTLVFENSIVLQMGETLTVLSGSPADNPPAGSLVWKTEHVWNNDGDTATLIGPNGAVDTKACSG